MSSLNQESAKLRVLCPKQVPYVLTCLACSRANVSCVLSCSRTNVSCMLTCLGCSREASKGSWNQEFISLCMFSFDYFLPLRDNMLCILSCQHALNASVSTCLACLCTHVLTWLASSRANMPWVPCLIQLVWLRDHLPTCFASSVTSLDATIFSFTVIAIEIANTAGKV